MKIQENSFFTVKIEFIRRIVKRDTKRALYNAILSAGLTIRQIENLYAG